MSSGKGMKLNTNCILYMKINLKWIKDIKITPKTIKLIEEKKTSFLTLIYFFFFIYLY